MKRLFFLFFFLFPFLSKGQANFGLGGKSAGMSNASINNVDLWGLSHNIGVLGFVENIEVGGYYENKYLLKQLNVGGIAAVYPIKNGCFGLQLNSFGFDLYRHTELGFGYSLKLAKFISVGVKLNYLNYKFGNEYNSLHKFTAEIGLMAKIKDKVAIGAHVYNFTRSKMADFQNERIPTVISLGVTYFISKKINITLEAEKDIDQKIGFRLGMDYQVHKIVSLRLGASSGPWLTTLGLGLKFKGFHIDLASSYHFQLGYSPQFSVSYVFPKKIKNIK